MSEKTDELLEAIKEEALKTAVGLDEAAKSFGNTPFMQGSVYLRHKIPWFWRTRKLQLRRIIGLSHPLWVGSDGIIYRGYGPWAHVDHPSYWMRAEIELRSDEGKRRILNALTSKNRFFGVP